MTVWRRALGLDPG